MASEEEMMRAVRVQYCLHTLGNELVEVAHYMLHHDADVNRIMSTVASIMGDIDAGRDVRQFEMRKRLAAALHGEQRSGGDGG